MYDHYENLALEYIARELVMLNEERGSMSL